MHARVATTFASTLNLLLELRPLLREAKGMASAEVVVVLVRRCAWCDRVFTASGWQPLPRGRDASERETATICPDCTEQLQGLGMSR